MATNKPHTPHKLLSQKPKGKNSTDQTQSSFLNLPPEIRNCIYTHVLEGQKLHVVCYNRASRRPAYRSVYLCQHEQSDEARVAWVQRERRDGLTLQSYSESHIICARRKAQLTPHITLGLLQVCQQIHREAALLPFTGTRFIFHSGGEMVDFMHSILILPQARAIRSVTLVAGTGDLHAKRVHRVLESKVRGLENLIIFLELQFGDHLTGPERARLTSKFRLFKSSNLSSLIIVGCNTNQWSRGGIWYPPVNRYRLSVAPIIEFEDAMKKLVIGAEDEDKDIENARTGRAQGRA
ncbi:hypothetical protein LTR97_000745 [Elasticomyces elasticus]|uniref:DUF7730 domain-containing protein n=1 Tax=Elasticomyces elasticus TaxID=574655 RepID=A0AAN7WK26_9PEZI|nr:hypothetical protein LTR97_000745 [Elasticomyces elasticus]